MLKLYTLHLSIYLYIDASTVKTFITYKL